MSTGELTVALERAAALIARPDADWERDGNGRPKILPDPTWDADRLSSWLADRADEEGRVCYTRVTTFAEALQDASALSRWKMRRVALGMGRRPDYVTAAAALTTEDRDKRALDDLAEKALEASGPNAADIGTAVHSFTERLDRGEPLGAVPDAYAADVDAYARAAAHLRLVEWECRTVCDELEVAGTPDRLGFCDVPDPDGIVDELRVIDTKTGKVDYSAGKISTQLAIYAHSQLYDPMTGARTSYEDKHGAPVSRWGLIVHVPAGSGRAELLWLNLDHGWAGAQQAAKVRDWRAGADARRLLVPVFARPPRATPTNGTCRGRLGNGKPCVYRAKDGGQWCGRHGDQQAQVDRWLAENPGADPDGGEDAPAPTTQPATAPAEQGHPEWPPSEQVQAAADASVADQLARRDGLLAPVAAEEYAATLPVEDEQAAPDDAGPDRGEAADVAAALGEVTGELEALVAMAPVAEEDEASPPVGAWRCSRSDLPRGQCACSSCRPDLAGVGDDGAERDPAPVRELPPVLGTYALDPAQEVNGNPRPVSGLQTPAMALLASARAQTAVLEQVQVARSESELLLLYRQHQDLWTPELTTAAGDRSAELARQQATERPEAALLAAITTADSTGTLRQLWTVYGSSELWTREHSHASTTRWQQLMAG